jgi:alkyldihydroxyacetonephosphate synthase
MEHDQQVHRHNCFLSHHHGVGRLLAPWKRPLKKPFDPHGILNPGGLLGLDLAMPAGAS